MIPKNVSKFQQFSIINSYGMTLHVCVYLVDSVLCHYLLFSYKFSVHLLLLFFIFLLGENLNFFKKVRWSVNILHLDTYTATEHIK